MGRCTLKAYKVSPEVFDNLLESFSEYVKITDNLNNYYAGYGSKHEKFTIMYDGNDTLICRDICLNYLCAEVPTSTYKQIIVRVDEGQTVPCMDDITGPRAWNFMIKELKKYYTKEEIDEIFYQHEAEYDTDLTQVHYLYPVQSYTCRAFDNCYKYDINGAHTDALVELFPKAKNFLLKLHRERKEHPVNKMYCNYFVGMIKHKGYEKTYNWVVQRTTHLLLNAIERCNGLLVYANTDGFIVYEPKNLLDVSTELGQFKEEYKGTVYVYRDKNYWVVQTGAKITGSVMYSVRKHLDLRQSQVVHYDKIINGNIYKCENIEKETLNESC